MSILHEICQKKRIYVEQMRAKTPLDVLKERIQTQEKPKGFIESIRSQDGTAIIAEVKKASPSQGVIRADFDPVKIAKLSEEHGAACLSVLTDEPYFQGCDAYLTSIKHAVSLPALRKDFVVDPYQVYESRALGADCILLIMAALDDQEAIELYELSTDLGMDVLVEIHDQDELERALQLNPEMIGVNNRNLKTLKVDIQTAFDLRPHIPNNLVAVAESGISSSETIKSLEEIDYDAFLIGTYFMQQDDIGVSLQNMRGA